MKSYSNSKNIEHIREVRRAADQLYELIIDLSLLYARRRRIAFSKAHQPFTSAIEPWGSYVANRIPLTTDSQMMHALFRPDASAIGGRLYYDTATSVAPSIVSNTAPVMALRRLDEHKASGMDASHNFDDEFDEYEDDLEVPANLSQTQALVCAQKMESSLEEFQNNRYAIDNSKRDDTSYITDNENTSQHDVTAAELFSPNYGHDEQELDDQSLAIDASDDAASLLQNFNTAASSHTGSYYASSHSGSEKSASGPRRKSRQATGSKLKSQQFLRESAVGRLQGFSFPEEKQNTIQEDVSEEITDEDFDFRSSFNSVEVSDEGEFA